MFLWPLVVAVTVLVLSAATIRYGMPALAHHRHERALARIAVLERQLGIAQPIEPLPERELRDATRSLWNEPAARVLADCSQCGRRVAVNVGACSGLNRAQLRTCAKAQYANTPPSLRFRL